MSMSFILSAKNSYLEKTSQTIYKGILNGEVLPYNYTDLYGKVSLNSSNGSKVNFFGFNFTDEVNNYKSISDFGWDSYGAGANFVVIPGKSPVLIEGNMAFSQYEAALKEQNNPDRRSSINGFNAGFAFTYFLGKNSLKYGIEMLGFKTVFDYTKSNGIHMSQIENTTELGAYIKYKAQLSSNPEIMAAFMDNTRAFRVGQNTLSRNAKRAGFALGGAGVFVGIQILI